MLTKTPTNNSIIKIVWVQKMHSEWLILGPAALYMMSMTLTPGPNNIMLTASGANFGFRRTMPHMWGILGGCFLLFAGIALGLGPYGVAMVAWDKALRWGHASLVGSLAYGVPVLAALLLVIAGMSVLDWRLPTAAVLVVVGCLKAGR